MNVLVHLLHSGPGLLLVVLALGVRFCWRGIKRALALILPWAARMIAWIIVAQLAVYTLRTLWSIFKSARSPEQRAFVVMGLYTGLMEAAAMVIARRTPSKRVSNAIREIHETLHPAITEYVSAIRLQSGRAP